MRLLCTILVFYLLGATSALPRIKRSAGIKNRVAKGKCNLGPAHSTVLSIRGGAAAASAEAIVAGGLPLYAVKLLLQIGLTLLNVLCWLVPLRSSQFSQNKDVLSIANAFSGGIFLTLGLAHLLPHSLEGLASTHANSNLAYYAVLGGYLVMLFIEKVIFNSHSLLHSSGVETNFHAGSTGHDHEHATSQFTTVTPVASSGVGSSAGTTGEACTLDHDHATHAHAIELAQSRKPALSPTTAIVLLAAMSVHSLFETMALGIASDRTSATMMAISVALHQPAESVALLVAFLKTSMPRTQIVKWLGVFSSVGLVGVVLGLFISKLSNPFMDALLVAMTAGTFLYVGATEVCNEEFEDGTTKEKLVKFTSLVGGIVLIGLVSKGSENWHVSHYEH